MSNTSWSNEEIAYAIIAKAEGKTYKEISKLINQKFGNDRSWMSIEGRLRKHRNETSRRVYHKWTTEQEDFIRKCRERKMSWKNVARKMQEQFGINRNANAIQSRMRQLDYEKMGRKGQIRWTQDKVDFIYSCRENGLSLQETADAVLEQYDEVTSGSNISSVLLRKRPSKELKEKILANRKKPVKKKLKKKTEKKASPKQSEDVLNWRYDRASRKQLRFIASLLLENPSQEQVRDFIYANESMTKGYADEIINSYNKTKAVKPVKNKTEKTVSKPEYPKFTREEDFDLLCEFYELSIDEARTKFNRPYFIIAERLETLFDSTEPKDVELLLEASKVVKDRKAKVIQAQMGFWKRRKLRRNNKRVERLQKQLDKIKGVE